MSLTAVFTTCGFENTTIERIAAGAGISERTFGRPARAAGRLALPLATGRAALTALACGFASEILTTDSHTGIPGSLGLAAPAQPLQ